MPRDLWPLFWICPCTQASPSFPILLSDRSSIKRHTATVLSCAAPLTPQNTMLHCDLLPFCPITILVAIALRHCLGTLATLQNHNSIQPYCLSGCQFLAPLPGSLGYASGPQYCIVTHCHSGCHCLAPLSGSLGSASGPHFHALLPFLVPLHCPALPCTSFQVPYCHSYYLCTALHCPALHCTVLHGPALHLLPGALLPFRLPLPCASWGSSSSSLGNTPTFIFAASGHSLITHPAPLPFWLPLPCASRGASFSCLIIILITHSRHSPCRLSILVAITLCLLGLLLLLFDHHSHHSLSSLTLPPSHSGCRCLVLPEAPLSPA